MVGARLLFRSKRQLPSTGANRGLLAVVSEPAGIPGMRSEHRSQKDTRTEDDHVADSGWEQTREHHEAKPEQPHQDQPPTRGSSGKAGDVRTHSAAKLGVA